jgi:hypothetical protein
VIVTMRMVMIVGMRMRMFRHTAKVRFVSEIKDRD